ETGGTERTVLVSVEEARRWTVGYGFGVDEQRLETTQPAGQYKASPRLSLEVSRLNVGGRAQTFSLRGRLSDLEKGGAASYLIPRVLNRPNLNLRFTGLDEETRDVLTFTAVRQEANAILERHSSPSTFILGRYTYRRVRVVGSTLRLQPEAIPLFSQPENVSAVGRRTSTTIVTILPTPPEALTPWPTRAFPRRSCVRNPTSCACQVRTRPTTGWDRI